MNAGINFITALPWMLVVALTFAAIPVAQDLEYTIEDRPDLIEVFERRETIGTFVLLDVSRGRLTLVNSARAEQSFVPASTFKFINSLIALELSVVANEDELIPYGGQAQPIDAWERDMTIGEAFGLSNVPVFQELARRIGITLYMERLEQISYGNAQVGTDVERFWLDGPLQISAVEQARFMGALAINQLPFSARALATVQSISVIERGDGFVLHGKTGWATGPEQNIGWFVGWITQQDRPFAFALNLDARSRSDLALKRILTDEFFELLGVFDHGTLRHQYQRLGYGPPTAFLSPNPMAYV